MAVAFRIPAFLSPDGNHEGSSRPNLTVVPAPKRRYVRVFVLLVPLIVALGMVVALRAHMAQQQMRIDRLNSDISRARIHFDSLRAQRASLQSPEVLVRRAWELGLVPSLGSRIVEIPADVAADVAANVGNIDADVVDAPETPLDEFGRLKPKVVGAP